MHANKNAPRWGAEEAVSVAELLIRNYDEDCGFADILAGFERHEFENCGPVTVCKTPNVLSFGGAKLGLDMVINPGTILKCMSDPDERLHGHGLDRDIFKYLIFELRNPVMLLRGSKENTLVAVTDLMDREGRPIIVSIALDRRDAHHVVNQITSAYGRNNFDAYLQWQLEFGNLLAVNRTKANQMFQSAGVQFPMEETLISFDNSIAYTFENVKIISTKDFENFNRNIRKDDPDEDYDFEDAGSGVESLISNAKVRSENQRNEAGVEGKSKGFVYFEY